MANWNNPTTTSLYTDFVTEVKSRDLDLAKGLDPTLAPPTNPVADMVRFNRTTKRWENYNGVSWDQLVDKATTDYDISAALLNQKVSGNASGNIPVSNGTANTNLNADMVDGKHADNSANNLLVLDGSGVVADAQLLATGVGAGTYKSVTVDVKGRVSAGTNPTTLGGFGITDAYTKAQDQQEAAHTGTPGGSANAHTLTLTLGTGGVYTDGMRVQYHAPAQNTGAVTLAVDGGTTRALKHPSGQDFTSGAIANGQLIEAVYRASDTTWYTVGVMASTPPNIDMVLLGFGIV